MPTTIYDSSLITQRRRDKTVSGSFVSRISPWNIPPQGSSTNQPNTGSAPMAGITEQSIINTVINGQMTDFRKNDGGCTTISPGCPCSTSAIATAALLPPGVVTNVQFSYGSIIATWDIPTTGGPALSYNVNLIPTSQYTSGLYFQAYNGYFADDVNWFNTATPLSGKNGYSSNLSTLAFATNNLQTTGNFFSLQWTGFFIPPTTDTYTFQTTSDDASYVWVGPFATSGYTVANALINNGGTHPAQTVSGSIYLTANVPVPIRVQFGENDGGEILSLQISNTGGPLNFTTQNYFISETQSLPATSYTTSYEYTNSQLLPPGNSYLLSVSASNNIGTSAPQFYGGNSNPTPIPTRYVPPTMTLGAIGADTCTITYNFPNATYGTGFTVTGATASPALPSGWTLTANNSQIVLTKAAPNPASLPSTQKFSLTGANPGETTYPSNAISGITTLGP